MGASDSRGRRGPSAVETAPTDERDIAAVAVRALSEASLASADYVLTGPAAVSHAPQVAIIGEVHSAGAWRSTSSRRTTSGAKRPPSAVEMLLAEWEAAVGHPAYVTTTVADLTDALARPSATGLPRMPAAFGTRAGRVPPDGGMVS